jgi:hypothetical protein
MSATVWTTLLDNFIKERPTDIITPAEILDVPLLEALKDNVDTSKTPNNGNIKIMLETETAMNARGVGDGADIQRGYGDAFVEMTVGLQRILAQCEITEKTMLTATGGDNSWGSYAGRKLDNMLRDFKYVQNIAASGNGTGALAVANGTATYTGGGSSYDSCTGAVITCDNTYTDSGIENTELIKKDMRISIWDASAGAFMTDSGGNNTEFKVTAVAPGKRVNGTYTATTGTVTIAVTTGLSAALADGDIIFLPGERSAATDLILPMGLTGFIQNDSNGTYTDGLVSPFNLATFQGVTRASYNQLWADVWTAGDFGLPDDNTDGKLALWDLSVVSDAMDEVYKRGGKINMLRCHPEMARTMHRLNRAESSIQVVVDSTKNENQAVVGSVRPKYFIDIEGELVPIIIDRHCPRYIIDGFDTGVLHWYPIDNADYRKYNGGGVWQELRGSRATILEASYEWWYNIGAERCDYSFRIQDLRTDL